MGVVRSRPTWRESFEWYWRGRLDVWGGRKLTIQALHSHNEDGYDDDLPNEIVVEQECGMDMGGPRTSSIRMDRKAAAQLVEKLQAALAWDGK